ncbi:MAG: trigger factor [Candidatus Paceibacterota bacterium]
MKIEKKDLPKSEVEFKIIVDADEFAAHHAKALASIQQVVEVDGFRKGNAPEDLIVKKYGDMIILEEMANIALREAYVKAVEEHKVSPISDPQVTITKIAKGNPLELTIVVPVIPELTLPAYKKLAKEVSAGDEKIEVTDKDIEDVLEELRKGRATQHTHEHNENCNHVEEAKEGDAAESKDETVLPELNDEFAQSFGSDFKNLVELKSKVGENLKLEKEQKLREKRRSAIMEKLIAETKAELPEVIVEDELRTMLAQMKQDITRFGGTWEEYLAHAKKTEEQLKDDWRNDAVKRAMSQLILHKIAQAEKLSATDEEIEVELVRVLATVQDADEERAKSYLFQALTNEKVLKFLENTEA